MCSSIMTRIYRRSAMILGSLQVGFIERKHNKHSHSHGTHIFGDIVYTPNLINSDNQIIWML